MLLEGKVEIHLLFLYPFLRRWCQKYTKILERFVKRCPYISGLFSSPFFVVSKSTHFRTKEGANNHEEIYLSFLQSKK